MSAEIIAIGSELTCGARLDTNSQWISRELESLGWSVGRHTTLADDLDAIVSELRSAAARSEIVILTGGLGPTLDDLTRDALAAAFQQPLVRDPESLRQIESLFAARGRPMPERNLLQADRPEHAVPLTNTCGTAPGILLRVTRQDDACCVLAALPGVPAEMRPMFEQQVKLHLPASSVVLRRRVLRTFGYGESEAERMLGHLTARGQNPEVGITASEAVISLSITARASSEEAAEQMCDVTEEEIRARLGTAVFASGDAELHDVVGDLLMRRGETILLVEGSTTGGLMCLWMTERPGLSSVVLEGQIRCGGLSSGQSLSHADSEHWVRETRELSVELLKRTNAAYVLFSSPFEDVQTDDGVTLRRGQVAVAGRNVFEIADAGMSGNLKIFRQRAARMALNRLRLILIADEQISGGKGDVGPT